MRGRPKHFNDEEVQTLRRDFVKRMTNGEFLNITDGYEIMAAENQCSILTVQHALRGTGPYHKEGNYFKGAVAGAKLLQALGMK